MGVRGYLKASTILTTRPTNTPQACLSSFMILEVFDFLFFSKNPQLRLVQGIFHKIHLFSLQDILSRRLNTHVSFSIFSAACICETNKQQISAPVGNTLILLSTNYIQLLYMNLISQFLQMFAMDSSPSPLSRFLISQRGLDWEHCSKCLLQLGINMQCLIPVIHCICFCAEPRTE